MKKNLKCFFDEESYYQWTDTAKRYHGSLTPKYEVLKGIKKIEVHISLEINNGSSWYDLEYQNPVNAHLFKPQIFTDKKKEVLRVWVANEQVAVQTIRGLFLSYKAMNISLWPEVVIRDRQETVTSYIDKWLIHDSVIFCRVESFLNFLKIKWFLDQGVDRGIVKDFAVNLELLRLDPQFNDMYERYKNLDFRVSDSLDGASEDIRKEFVKTSNQIINEFKIDPDFFDETFHVFPQKTQSPFLLATNLSLYDTAVTLVQLPWGINLAEELSRALFKRKEIKNFGLVGGVGLVDESDIEVDNIFKCLGMLKGEDHMGYEIISVKNEIVGLSPNTYFTNKKVVKGNINTVIPEFDYLSNLQKYRKSRDKFMAIDMEFEGFYKVLNNYRSLHKAFIYYIMDRNKSGYHLGDTYYNKKFLRELFSDFNRGKYYCFEKIDTWIKNLE